MRRIIITVIAFTLALTSSASASAIFMVSLDTSPLVGHGAAPFSLNFQLTDGSGLGNSSNTVALTDIAFGAGGSPNGAPSLVGGAAGDLSSSISLTDSSFFNAFSQTFQPGSLLSFVLTHSTNVEPGPQPDQFSFAILDSSGFEVPYESFFNAALVLDIDSANPNPLGFATDPNSFPFGGGDPIAMSAPTVTAAIPEPSTYLPVGLALASLLCWRRRP